MPRAKVCDVLPWWCGRRRCVLKCFAVENDACFCGPCEACSVPACCHECRLYPAGFQYTIFSAGYRGYAALDNGRERRTEEDILSLRLDCWGGGLSRQRGMEAESEIQASTQMDGVGPMSKDYLIPEEAVSTSVVVPLCKAEVMFNISPLYGREQPGRPLDHQQRRRQVQAGAVPELAEVHQALCATKPPTELRRFCAAAKT